MKKLLVTVDKNNLGAVEKLQTYGTIEKVSFLLNIFSVEVDLDKASEIKNIEGVLCVENNHEGRLMFA